MRSKSLSSIPHDPFYDSVCIEDGILNVFLRFGGGGGGTGGVYGSGGGDLNIFPNTVRRAIPGSFERGVVRSKSIVSVPHDSFH